MLCVLPPQSSAAKALTDKLESMVWSFSILEGAGAEGSCIARTTRR